MDTSESTTFGEMLKRYRVAAGLSQEALAERAGMSARGISDLERGVRRMPYRSTITRLAVALQLDETGRAALEQAARRVRDSESGTSRAQAPVAENELLATKLIPPTPRPTLVSRPRLLQRLDAGLTCPLILIAAPAGSGKTTLLAAWQAALQERGIRLAWVSLDPSDNDASRFGRYLVTALNRCVPGVGDGVLDLLEMPQPPPAVTLLTPLVNALAAVSHDVVLVLDDYHVITAQDVHDGVAFLLEHLPPHVHLVIGARADPRLPLARLRGRGLMTELRARDLRFTLDEAAAFLGEVMGLPLSAQDISALEARTEGWIAGLQLAALSLQGRSPEGMEEFIASFSGSHRHVVDYLTDEVLARLPTSVQTFLLHTPVLKRLCASLCAFLMEGRAALLPEEATEASPAASQEMLEQLERSNLFLVALDDHREWYRYHHLFADALRHRLQHQHPDLVLALHERASTWFAARGLLDEAIAHALEARAFERAATLIEHAAPALRARGEGRTVETWLRALPKEIVQTHPYLSLAQAWMALDDADAHAAENLLQIAEQALQASNVSAADQDLEGEITAARALAATTRGEPAQAIVHAEQALERLDPGNAWTRGLVATTLGLSYAKQQSLGDAACVYREAEAAFRSLGNKYLGLRAMLFQSYVQRGQGRLRDATRTCEQALDWAGSYSSPVVGLLYMHLADLLREWNDLDDALRYATEAIPLVASLEVPDIRVFPHLVLARVKQARGDLDGALVVLDQTKELARDPKVVPYRPLLRAFETQLHLIQGRCGPTEQIDSQAVDEGTIQWMMHPFFVYAYEHAAAMPIQVLLVRGRVLRDPAQLEAALALAERQYEQAERVGLGWYRVKLLALQALAYHAFDDTARFRGEIEQALVLAHAEGFIRVFADEGEPMRELLREVDPAAIEPDYLQRLMGAVSSSVSTHNPVPPGTAHAL